LATNTALPIPFRRFFCFAAARPGGPGGGKAEKNGEQRIDAGR
jgi:hypothetical protein